MNPENPDWATLAAHTHSSYVGVSCGPGWDELVMMVHHSLKALDPDYRINQIKEKFAGLRYYFTPSEFTDQATRDRMHSIADLAGELSMSLCEECGAHGEPCNPSRFWIKTLCESCLEESKELRRLRYEEAEQRRKGDGS